MNFYENFLKLCSEKGVAPSRALLDAGLSKSLANKWKKFPDVAPSGPTLTKLSAYFNVSFEELIPTLTAPGSSINTDTDLGIKKEPIRLDGLSKVQIETYEMLDMLSPDDFQHVHDFCAGLLASKSHD